MLWSIKKRLSQQRLESRAMFAVYVQREILFWDVPSLFSLLSCFRTPFTF